MKTTVIRVLSLTLMVLLAQSCSNNDSDTPLNGDNPPGHLLESLSFTFQNKKGEDLLKTISLKYNESGYCDLIEEGFATLQVTYCNEYLNPYSPYPGGVSGTPDPSYAHLIRPSVVVVNETLTKSSGDLVFLAFSSAKLNMFWGKNLLPFPERIVYKLAFEDLFGNKTEREIITYWKPLVDDIPYSTVSVCDKVEIDGQTFVPSRFFATTSESDIARYQLENGHGNYYSIVNIVLDRE